MSDQPTGSRGSSTHSTTHTFKMEKLRKYLHDSANINETKSTTGLMMQISNQIEQGFIQTQELITKMRIKIYNLEHKINLINENLNELRKDFYPEIPSPPGTPGTPGSFDSMDSAQLPHSNANS